MFSLWGSRQDPARVPKKGPCSQIVVYARKVPIQGLYFKAKVYTLWVHGP